MYIIIDEMKLRNEIKKRGLVYEEYFKTNNIPYSIKYRIRDNKSIMLKYAIRLSQKLNISFLDIGEITHGTAKCSKNI